MTVYFLHLLSFWAALQAPQTFSRNNPGELKVQRPQARHHDPSITQLEAERRIINYLLAMTTAFSSARSLAARTVHIKISPSARSFRECREVLLELEEKCGEIAMFRSLKVRNQLPNFLILPNIKSSVPSHIPRPKRSPSRLPNRKCSPKSAEPNPFRLWCDN